jgi:dolichyl-phosphate-mannose-protein mannosyltransferase
VCLTPSALSLLHQLPNPGGVVFDESHFGGFTEHYLQGKYFFDIHPPLAKLTIALYAHLMGECENCGDSLFLLLLPPLSSNA